MIVTERRTRWYGYPRRLPRIDEIRVQQQAIGVRLRTEFENTVLYGVPREWLDLLRQADARATVAA